MHILGLSCYFHDSAACLIRNGRVIAAAQEERFSRKKHDPDFPARAVAYCLKEAAITLAEVDEIVFYEKPFLKFDRLISTHIRNWPFALGSFLKMQDQWLGGKIRMRSLLQKKLGIEKPITFCRHHESHAASVFFTSPFERATVVTVDGVGEWATTAIFRGEGSKLTPIREIRFPHSLGLFYSAFTTYLGFEANEDEYKVMGLAPYGKPVYAERLKDDLIKLHSDGSFFLSPKYFTFERGSRMLNERRVRALLDVPARGPKDPILGVHENLAASVQVVLEEALLKLCASAIELTGEPRLCLAGGVALNCVANSKIRALPGVEDFYVFPAAGDAGGAAGAALYSYYHAYENARTSGAFAGPFLGPEFLQKEIDDYLTQERIPHVKLPEQELVQVIAGLITEQKVVGWFQGRMEYGPRALGNRSILGDPRKKENWQRINQKVKFREDFRPLAPAVLEEASARYFDLPVSSPYMLLTAKNLTEELPAVTHVDGSSRLQTVSKNQNPLFHRLLSEFSELTGVPALINTSFNTAGMPIVCTPADAFQCFSESRIDVLVLGNSVVRREDCPALSAWDTVRDAREGDL